VQLSGSHLYLRWRDNFYAMELRAGVGFGAGEQFTSATHETDRLIVPIVLKRGELIGVRLDVPPHMSAAAEWIVYGR
jgi:hypothetical protein